MHGKENSMLPREIHKQRMNQLREKSGKVISKDPLVSFLYELMRDHLPAGTVETLINGTLWPGSEEVLFTNGFLARYAENLAEILRSKDHMLRKG